MALLGLLLPAVALADNAAHLTIGGVVPPRQRVAVVQSGLLANGEAVTLLQEQNNSGLAYTVTVEGKAEQGSLAKQTHVRSGLAANRAVRAATGMSPIRIAPVTGAVTTVVTVASQ